MGNPSTVSELKYTSGCGTFPNASLQVRTFDYFIVVTILLRCDSTSFSRGARKSYALSLRSGTRMSPATLTAARFGFIN